MRTKNLIWLMFLMVAVSCGGSSGGDDGVDGSPAENNDGSPGGGIDGGDTTPGIDGGSTPGIDGGIPPGCGDPGATQCNNCMDDDGDGLIDGDDVHCISAQDDDESSFATGIPGDNKDPHQDCFFDGNSGNDGCDIDTCCLLGTCEGEEDCTVSDQCKAECGPATPPGCDCFGCCTICDGANCQDILIIPGSTPGWDCDNLDNLGDPDKCPQCTKVADCGTACDEGEQNADCILCPGQTEEDLPAECNNMNECPDGKPTCATTEDCGSATAYCSNGCCIDIVIE